MTIAPMVVPFSTSSFRVSRFAIAVFIKASLSFLGFSGPVRPRGYPSRCAA